MSDVTQILAAIRRGEEQAAQELLPLVYGELRRLAAQKMSMESAGHTLQPTALVHEAWLRLGGRETRRWNDRAHFFAAAAEAMRLILIDNARRKRTQRHGGGKCRIELSDNLCLEVERDEKILAVNDALEKFAKLDPAKAELVKLRYFVGLSVEEAAAVLGISDRTAKRHWAFARAWLHEELRSSPHECEAD